MKKDLKLLRRKTRSRFMIKSSKSSSFFARLSVFKSGRHIYAQIINLKDGAVIVSASSLDKEVKKKNNANYCNKNSALLVGELLAKRAEKKEIPKIVFDKSGYKYHGIVALLADQARKTLNF